MCLLSFVAERWRGYRL
uniref:Uncharacterized protein n=1 Tax=Arundo donax TaxID=35708 RepID=A0A0A9G3I3_ARUDO